MIMQNEPFENERQRSEALAPLTIMYGREFYSDSDLVETLEKYDDGFEQISRGEDGEAAYCFFEPSGEPYLIFAAGVSNSMSEYPHIMSVTSKSKERNSQILQDFQEKTGTELRPAFHSLNFFMQWGQFIGELFNYKLNTSENSQEDSE